MSIDGLLRIARSPVHGRGLFAARALPRDHLLGVYTGRAVSARNLARRRLSSRPSYLFILADGSAIDGTGPLRHLNHSCTPNCVAIEQAGQVLIYTRRAVRAGAELTLDYHLEIDDPADSALYPCRCGAKRCRGTMARAA